MRRLQRLRSLLLALALWLSTDLCFAPFVYTPGEGWRYETPGQAARWRRDTATEQIEVARKAFEEGEHRVAIRAAGRIFRQWPRSDYAAEGQFLAARAYERLDRPEKAFKAYQRLLTYYPRFEDYNLVLERKFEIANLFLEGRRFRLWGLFPLFRSMNRTTEMYRQLIGFGPYSEVAPRAQLRIGQAQENRKRHALAFLAYEKAADQYSDQPEIVSEALFQGGMALMEETREAEYDQSLAKRAIEVFEDFVVLYPDDPRAAIAERNIRDLRVEQARGSLKIARYYEKRDLPQSALIYYNSVVDIFSRLVDESGHEYAVEARRRIARIQERTP